MKQEIKKNKSMKTKKSSELIQKVDSFFSVPLIIIIFFICIFSAGYELRQNNVHMLKLRKELLAADVSGANVENSLNNLRGYVFGHMNTNVNTGGSLEAPIQLVNTYYRAILQVEARDASQNGSQALYNRAVEGCNSQEGDLYKNVTCVENYLTTHGSGLKNQNLPLKEMYQFNFVSPWWSADLAGWLVVLSVLIGFSLVIKIARTIGDKNSKE
jgi:hypothetical protein